ncbi:hypothetical protein Hypma_005641 [Hypsizygus marmoreus]|uniref:Uncharacterized protein n=1 Tax=Hypsizygus marmoreus TaxID=39966 RepID=A0A369JXN9_HYPMA|nr:hypothetical protein Hypma_005641 [Hypsizygus marmoreus]
MNTIDESMGHASKYESFPLIDHPALYVSNTRILLDATTRRPLNAMNQSPHQANTPHRLMSGTDLVGTQSIWGGLGRTVKFKFSEGRFAKHVRQIVQADYKASFSRLVSEHQAHPHVFSCLGKGALTRVKIMFSGEVTFTDLDCMLNRNLSPSDYSLLFPFLTIAVKRPSLGVAASGVHEMVHWVENCSDVSIGTCVAEGADVGWDEWTTAFLTQGRWIVQLAEE